jgi:hypothetical protein
MTSIGKRIRDKFCDIVDRGAARKFLLCENGDEKYIRADVAKSLIAQAIEEYERTHETPIVDFWGQPYEEE